jgi:hypothetical protein
MMKNISADLGKLSDQDLLARVRDAAVNERCATAKLIALLMELDARRLYLGEGCSSLFTYCTQVLHLSEHAAYVQDSNHGEPRDLRALAPSTGPAQAHGAERRSGDHL